MPHSPAASGASRHGANAGFGPARATTYAEAGVDIDAGEQAVSLMRPAIDGAARLANRFGSFGSAVESPGSDMLLVSSADGVGTKLCLARNDAECAALGRDLVHHCINDILTSGARPLFFLDYLAFARLNPTRAAAIVTGMAAACASHGCALVGGETAELPDLYQDDAFDMAGFIVGSVERTRLLTGNQIEPGDILVGLPAVGLHTNGFTLARNLLAGLLDQPLHPISELVDGGDRDIADSNAAITVREALLTEHRCYLRETTPLLDRSLIRGIAHITGGGLPGNLPRMLPDGLSARLDPTSWRVPRIFRLLADFNLEPREMYRAFNMGIGMVLACPSRDVDQVIAMVPDAVVIGYVEAQSGAERVTGLW